MRIIMSTIITIIMVLIFLLPPGTASANLDDNLQSIQIPFIENQGQVDLAVGYYAQTFWGTFFVKRTGELSLALPSQEQGKRICISEQLEGTGKISLTPLHPSPDPGKLLHR